MMIKMNRKKELKLNYSTSPSHKTETNNSITPNHFTDYKKNEINGKFIHVISIYHILVRNSCIISVQISQKKHVKKL